MWPFSSSKPKVEPKKKSKLDEPASPPGSSDTKEKPKRPTTSTGLYTREDLEKRAENAVKKHRDACARSAFMDAVNIRKVEAAKEATNKAVNVVQKQHDQISGVLQPQNGKTVQELAEESHQAMLARKRERSRA